MVWVFKPVFLDWGVALWKQDVVFGGRVHISGWCGCPCQSSSTVYDVVREGELRERLAIQVCVGPFLHIHKLCQILCFLRTWTKC